MSPRLLQLDRRTGRAKVDRAALLMSKEWASVNSKSGRDGKGGATVVAWTSAWFQPGSDTDSSRHAARREVPAHDSSGIHFGRQSPASTFGFAQTTAPAVT